MNVRQRDREAIRRLLEQRSFVFCDALAPGPSEEDITFYANYCKTASRLESLLEEAVEASSTDAPDQGIENTMQDDMMFWSSGGTREEDRNEVVEKLTYRLKSPLTVVHSVGITVYKAEYQWGEPLYPPFSVSVAIGNSPRNMTLCTPEPFPIRPDDATQVVMLPYMTQPMGGYLQVRFHGKQQMQFTDGEYYLAIRKVQAHGLCVPVEHMQQIQPALRCSQLYYPSPFSASDIPSSCILETGRTVLEEMHHRIKNLSDPEEEQLPGPQERAEAPVPWYLNWQPVAEGTYRVYDFPELL